MTVLQYRSFCGGRRRSRLHHRYSKYANNPPRAAVYPSYDPTSTSRIASSLVRAMSTSSVNTRGTLCRHCRDVRVYGLTTTATHGMTTFPLSVVNHRHGRTSQKYRNTYPRKRMDLQQHDPKKHKHNKSCSTSSAIHYSSTSYQVRRPSEPVLSRLYGVTRRF